MIEAEARRPALDSRRSSGFNGAASVIEAEGLVPIGVADAYVELQRGRLGDRGGGSACRWTRGSRTRFNGAASVIEAEAAARRSSPPAQQPAGWRSFNGAASVIEAEADDVVDALTAYQLQRGRLGDRGGGRRGQRPRGRPARFNGAASVIEAEGAAQDRTCG